VVATLLYVVIRFKVDKRTIIAQVFDIDNGRNNVTVKARVDGDVVIGGFGHGVISSFEKYLQITANYGL